MLDIKTVVPVTALSIGKSVKMISSTRCPNVRMRKAVASKDRRLARESGGRDLSLEAGI